MSKLDILLISAAGVSFFGFAGTAIYAHINAKRLKRLSDKFGVAIDHIVDETDIQIPQEIMDRAMNEAVKRAAKNQVDVCAISIATAIKDEMRNDIRKRVDACTSDMESDIKTEYRKQVKNLDMKAIHNEVVAEVSRNANKQVKDAVDDIVERSNDKLETVTRVYESIEERFDLA